MKDYLLPFLKNRPLFYAFIRPYEAEIFAAKIPIEKPVLDFGCGDGFFAKVAFGKRKVDVGLDLDPKKLEEARLEKIYKRVVQYDGHKIPFGDSKFSTVVSNSVLEHVDNLDYSLKEINRVLKHGGKFLCTVMTKKWEDYLFGSLVFGKYYKNWMRYKQKHINLYDLEGWRQVFAKAGFKTVEIKGYLGKRDSRLIDILHYLSISSLFSYKLFGKWVLFPQLYTFLPLAKVFWSWKEKVVKRDVSASLFFELHKV